MNPETTCATESVSVAETDATHDAVVVLPFRSFSPVPNLRISKLIFLGTSSAKPLPGKRNVSCLAVALSSGNFILMDCGEGSQHQIDRAQSVKPSKLDLILITHLHGDHSFGIFGMLCSIRMGGRQEPITVVGPLGIQSLVTHVLTLQGGTGLPLHFIELEGSEPIQLGPLTDGILVTAHSLKHGVPCFGYTLTEPSRAGSLNAKLALELGAKNQQLGQLKDGLDVVLEDGRVIRSADVVGAGQKGRTIALVQDTFASLESSILEACADAAVVVHEATYHHDLLDKCLAHGHSTARMAGMFAQRCHAKLLVLTHFSSRYMDQRLPSSACQLLSASGDKEVDMPAPRTSIAQSDLKERERQVFVQDLVAEAQAACSCQVIAACDFMRLDTSKSQEFVLVDALDLKPNAQPQTSWSVDDVLL